MAAAELAILIRARDEASRTFKEIEKNAHGMGATLQTIGKIGFAGLAVGLGALAKFTQEAAKEQANIARLQTALGHLDAANRAQAAGVEEMIAKREQLAFSDDALRDSLSLLVTQTGNYTDSLNRQKIAMDVSRGTGIDLQTASKLLGKINDETTNTFARYGIVIRKGATETEALAMIQSRFSGQSEAYAKTAAGQWDIVQIKFQDIREDIGNLLLPTVLRLSTALGAFLTEHQADIERMAHTIKDDLAIGFEIARRAVQPMLDAFDRLPGRDKIAILTALAGVIGGVLVTSMLAFAAASVLAFATNPITVWIVAIGLAVTAAVLIARHWDQIWVDMKTAPQSLLDWFTGGGWKDVALFIASPIALGLKLVIQNWEAIFDAMPSPVQSAMNLVASIVAKTLNFIIDRLNSVLDGFNRVIDAANKIPGVGIPNVPNVPNVGDFQLQPGAGLGPMFGPPAPGALPGPSVGVPDLGEGQFGGSGGSAAAGLSDAEKAAQQGLIDMALAFADFTAATGLGETAFMAYIQVAQDKAALDEKATQTAIGLAAAQLEANDAGFQLQKSLVAIAEDALRSGMTIERESQKLWEGIVSGIQGAFGALNSSQTKEGAQRQLAIDRAQLAFDEAKRHGASEDELKGMQKRIDRLQEDEKIAEDNNRIQKDLFDVADAMLPTEQEKLFREQLYIIAQRDATTTLVDVTAIASLQGIAQQNYIDALGNAASALGSQQSAADPFSAAEKHWINGVAIGKGEPEPFPGFKSGGVVPYTGLWGLTKGEEVLTEEQQRQRGDVMNVYNIHVHTYEHHGDAETGIAALTEMARG